MLDVGLDLAADSMAQEDIKDSLVSMEVWRKNMLVEGMEVVVAISNVRHSRRMRMEGFTLMCMIVNFIIKLKFIITHIYNYTKKFRKIYRMLKYLYYVCTPIRVQF